MKRFLLTLALLQGCQQAPEPKHPAVQAAPAATAPAPSAPAPNAAPTPSSPPASPPPAAPTETTSPEAAAPSEGAATPAATQESAPEPEPAVEPEPLTPEQVKAIKERIIQQSIDEYTGSCPCPYNRARNGSRCGGRSAWSRKGGAAPLCYEDDVTQEMVEAFRSQ